MKHANKVRRLTPPRSGERAAFCRARHRDAGRAENTRPTPPSPAEAASGLPDILASNLKVIFCGINPGESAARHGHHFLGRGNRFWRVLYLAGFTPVEIRPANDRDILRHGCGLTTAVKRPTSRADLLAPTEFASAADELARKVARYAPRSVAFLGKSAFAAMYQVDSVAWGRQPLGPTGAETWVLPNPSGLNRGFRLNELVAAYRELRRAVAQGRGRR